MAEIRFNYGDKFTQTSDSNTGIGSTNPAAKLDIAGGTSAGSLRVSGIATLSSYQGFVNTKLSTTENLIVEAGQSGSVSGEVVIGTGQTISVSTGATTGQGGIQSLKVSQTFMPPVGGTADRPTDVKPGMVYYNKDFKTIEFWDGNFWKQVDNTIRSSRAVFTGGAYSSYGDFIDFVNISTLGNAQEFGRTITSARFFAACSSGTRGVYAVGYKSPGASANEIEYITIASEGNAIDFGDSTVSGYAQSSLSSSTRGIWGGRQSPSGYSNVIDYVEIASIGNAVDFGDTTTPLDGAAGVASPTRGVICGGRNPDSGSTGVSNNQFITIASKGNANDDGDLTHRRKDLGGLSNSTRGILSGGRDGSAGIQFSDIDFITIASLGNAQDFGNLTFSGAYLASASNQIRGVTAGGNSAPNYWNIINFVTIATTGNAQDFGDLTVGRYALGALSDSHGGLGGF